MPKQFKATIEEHGCTQPNCLKISLESGYTIYTSTTSDIATLAKHIKSLSEDLTEANKTKNVVQIGVYSGYVFLKDGSVFH
jgi:Na+/H+-dicarboxylate symporter